MKPETMSPQQKKLRTIRRILLTCFLGIAIFSILLMSGVAFAVNPTQLDNDFAASILMFAPLFLIVGFGVVCMIVYYFFKYRLEKEDDLFP